MVVVWDGIALCSPGLWCYTQRLGDYNCVHNLTKMVWLFWGKERRFQRLQKHEEDSQLPASFSHLTQRCDERADSSIDSRQCEESCSMGRNWATVLTSPQGCKAQSIAKSRNSERALDWTGESSCPVLNTRIKYSPLVDTKPGKSQPNYLNVF